MLAKPTKSYDSFIFTHIPKCGGTSFREFLFNGALDSDIPASQIYIPGYNKLSVRKNIESLNFLERFKFKRTHYKVVGMHCDFMFHNEFSNTIRDPFYYTLLRNPIERFISHYYYFWYLQSREGCGNVHLNDLPQEKLDFAFSRFGNLQAKHLVGRKGDISDNKMLDLAKANLCSYDAFGFIENLDHSLVILKDKSPDWLTFPESLKQLNSRNKSLLYLDNVKPSVLEQVKAANRVDVELYRFAESIFEEQI